VRLPVCAGGAAAGFCQRGGARSHALLSAGASETTQLDIILSEYAEFTVEGNTAVHLSGMRALGIVLWAALTAPAPGYYMPDFDMDGGGARRRAAAACRQDLTVACA